MGLKATCGYFLLLPPTHGFFSRCVSIAAHLPGIVGVLAQIPKDFEQGPAFGSYCPL